MNADLKRAISTAVWRRQAARGYVPRERRKTGRPAKVRDWHPLQRIAPERRP